MRCFGGRIVCATAVCSLAVQPSPTGSYFGREVAIGVMSRAYRAAQPWSRPRHLGRVGGSSLVAARLDLRGNAMVAGLRAQCGMRRWNLSGPQQARGCSMSGRMSSRDSRAPQGHRDEAWRRFKTCLETA